MTVIYLDSAPFTVIACLRLASNADHGGGEMGRRACDRDTIPYLVLELEGLCRDIKKRDCVGSYCVVSHGEKRKY